MVKRGALRSLMKPEVVIHALQERIRAQKRSATISAEGTSMEPTIFAGDPLNVDPSEVTQLKAGDVILFQQGRTMIVHRVCEIDEAHQEIICKGDNRKVIDAPVPFHAVIGKVSHQSPTLLQHLLEWKARWQNICGYQLRKRWKGRTR